MTAAWSRALALVTLAIALAFAGWVRLAHLDVRPLWVDEENHYHAARGLLRTGAPTLPSGVSYTRGLDYTRLVALALPHVHPIERAVRLPAAVLGTLAVLVFAVALWAWGGAWAGVWGALLLGVYPVAVEFSRLGRFYAPQLLAGVVALYAGWRVVRRPGALLRPDPVPLGAQWAWAALTLGALVYATRLTPVTLSVGAGWGACVVLAAIVDLTAWGASAWRRSAAVQLAGAGLLVGIGALAIVPHLTEAARFAATAVPYWARVQGPPLRLAYYYALSEDLGMVLSLAPLAFLVLLVRQPRLALYLAVWFAVPVILHSVVLQWQAPRYILLAVPALLAAVALAAADGAGVLYRWLRSAVARQPQLAARAGALAAVATASACLAATLTWPAFSQARKAPLQADSSGWRAAGALLRAQPALARLPLGHTEPLGALTYLSRLDFTVHPWLLESWTRNPDFGRPGEGPFLWKRMGAPDPYAGVPVLLTPEAIRARFTASGGVVIGAFGDLHTESGLMPALEQELTHHATELCQGRCGSMRLYHWSFGPAPDRATY